VILVASLLPALAVGCGGDRAAAALAGSAALDQSEITGLHLIQYEAGERTADIEAERGVWRSGEGSLELFQVNGRLRAEDPKQPRHREIRVRAAEGRADVDGGKVFLSGGVHLRSGDYSVEVPTLEVDRAARQARSSDRAHLTGPGFEARGQGLLVRLDEERLVLLSEVRARYRGSGEAAP